MKAAHIKGGKGQRTLPNRMDVKKTDSDAIFMYNVAVLVGCPCEVTIKDGRKYDGIFCAYDQDKHELLFEAAHLVTDDSNDESPITEHHDVLVVSSSKMLSARFKSVDINYATRDFVTDQAISSTRGMSLRDKELTPWDGPDVGSDDDLSIETDMSLSSNTKENGWEAKDMFKKNEEKYGITSSYSHDLSGYTTKIDKSDPDSLKQHEQRALQVAQEIEKNTVSWERSELENGEDEEEAFSAVVRPRNSGIHPNLNNNNNSISSNSGSDKYIPPSRRQGNSQPSAQSMPQNVPLNNNGASQMNNNGNNPRKQVYGQNQNPRGGYGVIQNNVYHDRRSNYDNRRGPPPNQYPPPNSHNEPRRMDDGNRQHRVPNKPQTDRRGGGGREDPAKLKEFSTNFRLQTSSDQNQPRRMPHNQLPPNAPPPASGSPNIPPGGPNPNAGAPMPARNPTPPSNTNAKVSKEAASPPPSATQGHVDATEKGSAGAATPNPNSTLSSNSNTGSGNVHVPSMNEMTPVSGTSTNDEAPGSADSKLNDSEPKKKFSFNPNAKEFNPSAKSFTSRSPSTPPRPPSTPAQQAPSTPQQMQQTQQQMPSFMQIPMQMPGMPTMLYAQPYAQTAALIPSSNSSASSAGATPRHGGHRKGGGMLGVPPRSEMTPPIQMTTGPPILAPASIQAGSAPPLYAFVPGQYSQVIRGVPQNVMSVFHSESGGSGQMHQQVHYIQHNGAPTPSSGGHPNSNTPSNTPTQTTVVSANSQGYSQSGGNHRGAPHVGYPFVGVPVMNIPGYPHGPPPHMILPYVPHSHQGD